MSTNENMPLLEDSSSGRQLPASPANSAEIVEPGWGAAGEYMPAGGDSALNLVSYMHGLRRHWLLAAVLGSVLGSLLAVGVWFGWGAQFAPKAFLRVSPSGEKLIRADPNEQRFTQFAFDIYKDTQRQLMTSPLVLSAALSDQKINRLPSVRAEDNPDPIAWLQKELSISFPGDAEIMQVSLKGTDPNELRLLVNKVVNTYMEKIVYAETGRRRERLAELNTVYTAKESEVRRKGQSLKTMAKNLGADEPDAIALKQRLAIQELNDYQRQLAQVTFELNRAESGRRVQEELLKNVDEMQVSQLELDRFAQADPVIREMSKELANRRLMLDYTESVARPGATSRHVSQHQQDMYRVQEELKAMNEQLRVAILDMKREEIAQELSKFEIEKAVAEDQKVKLEAVVQQKRRDTERLSGSFVELNMGYAQLEELNGVLAEIAREREALSIEVKARPRVTVLEEATMPKSSVNFVPRAALSMLMMIVGLCVPGGLIAWLDVRSRRINSTKDVSNGLGLTVLGSMPLIPTRVLKQLGTAPERHQAWHMRLTEAVDSTVARLLRKAELEQRRVILVTSPTGGEGKTTLATQLALSLTRNGRRTVLVDFDLRQPALDQAFGLPLEPGISEVLRQENSLADVIQPTDTDNLSIVAAGRWDRRALAALANGAAGPIFDALREEAEFVVIDASAVLPVADTRFVSQHVDTVLLSIFRDVSQSHKIQSACEILEAFGVESLETVVTCPTDHLRGRDLKFDAGHVG